MSQEPTYKQELFAQKYDELGNGSEAYRQAYDASAMSSEAIHVEASRLLQNPKVTLRVKELQELRLQRHQVTIDRVVAEYAKLAFLDIRRAFDCEGNLKPIHEMDEDTAAAISGLEVEVKRVYGESDEELEGQAHGGSLKRQHGTTARLHKIKLIDKKGALDSLAKYLKMYSDTNVNVNVNGTPLPEDDKATLSDYAREEAN